jgi:hypothetical protein
MTRLASSNMHAVPAKEAHIRWWCLLMVVKTSLDGLNNDDDE